MPKREDHTGERYGRLIVLKFSYRGKRRESHWLCSCDCGRQHVVSWGNLRAGTTRSCGCLHDEVAGDSRRLHGKTGTRTYGIWKALKKRCLNPSGPKWDRYGGRGITVCDRWKADFSAFLADMGECPAGRSIDRIDNNGNYEPGNCRWATATEQARNKSNNRRLNIDGTLLTITECSEQFGVTVETIEKRIARGVPVSAAVKTRTPIYATRVA